MDIPGTIAAGLAGACVDEHGRLIEHPLLDCSSRAALIADLIRLGRLQNGSDAIQVDSEPLGWAPLDRTVGLLTAGESTLDQWILTGSPGLHDVVDDLVAVGAWTRKKRGLRRRLRYDPRRPRDRWGRTPERGLLQPLRPAPASPRDAAVLLLVWAAGLDYRDQPVDAVLARTADLRWFCELAWQVVGEEGDRNRQAVRAMRLGRTIGAPG